MSSALRSPAPASVNQLAAGRRNAAVVSGGRKALGTVTYAANLSAGDKVTMNGVDFTAVAAGAAGNQFNIGADLAATLAAMLAVISASVDPPVTKATYMVAGSTFRAIAAQDGTAGNSFTIGATGGATLSGSTLTGGTDASEMDVDNNSVFLIDTAAGTSQNLALPIGVDEGQEITIYLRTKGAGSSAIISGVFNGGTTLTLDTVDENIKLMWTGAKWGVIVNNGGVIA